MVDLLAFLIVNLMAFLFGGMIGLLLGSGFFPMAWIILAASYGVAVVGFIGCQCGFYDEDWM